MWQFNGDNMKFLELKIPPLLIFAIAFSLMWLTSLITNRADMNKTFRLVFSIISLAAGGSIALAGAIEFKKAKTTFDPLNPNLASLVVSTGIYQHTRNPMYLGLLFGLLAWTSYLDNLYSFIFVLFFHLYMTRFQIKPEERILKSNFGKEDELYLKRVRRWL